MKEREPDFYSLAEVARLVGLTRQQVSEDYRVKGELAVTIIAGRPVVSEGELKRYAAFVRKRSAQGGKQSAGVRRKQARLR